MSIRGAPPLRHIERALRAVTERLPLELSLPAPPPPRWSELEWMLAPAVAVMHGISPLLASTPLLGRPCGWGAFLAHQRIMTATRHRRIIALLESLDARARHAGITLTPLKGAALSAIGIYAGGERPMADLDLLVRGCDVGTAAQVLESVGYRETGTTWKHRTFDPIGAGPRAEFGEHADNPVKIDLHVRILERLPLEEHDFTELVRPARADPGLQPYPSVAALMLHVLAHTAGTMVHRGVRLIQLEDIARLAARMAAQDWGTLLKWHGSARRLWWAAAPLLLAARYRRIAVPEPVLVRLRRDCPRLLRSVAERRTLTDFSYSHPRIDPAPGLAWVRSGTELWKYCASRARPSRQQLAQLELLARTEPWSAEPAWYAQSQTARIVRWLTSRPVRTETMQPVRAVLARRVGA